MALCKNKRRKGDNVMLCEKILGNISDEAFAGKAIDYVEIEWHEAFKKLHKKETKAGETIGIRLGNEILTRGLKDGDVLYADDEKVVVVEIPPCEAIIIEVDEHHGRMKEKVCYEIGNKHATLFWGDKDGEYVTPYNEPTLVMLNKLHGVSARKEIVKLNFEKSISSSINNHTH